MKLTTFIISIAVLLCVAMSLRAVEVPAGAVWSSDFDLDTFNVAPGKTIVLRPTDAITYSTQWAYGENRRISLFATAQNPYEIMTSGVEAEGSYVWNYESVDPSVLPRNATYTLSYTITSGQTTLTNETAEARIKLLPEPSLLFLLPLLLLLCGARKIKLFVPALLLALISFEAAADVVSGISCRQRWPWNGKVDIDYTLSSQNGNASPVFSVSFYGMIGNGEPFVLGTLKGDGQYGLVLGDGQKKLVWDSSADLGHTVDSSEVKIAIYAEDVTGNAGYLIFDLTGHTVGFTSTPPTVSQGADCKSSKLWFKRINSGNFIMGSDANEPGHESANETEHAVAITKPFYIGIFEMTQAQYTTIFGSNPSFYHGALLPVERTGYSDLRGQNAGSTWPTYTDYRVDANSFFGVFRTFFGGQFLFDLPTEAQWEMACRDKGNGDHWGSGKWNDGSMITGTLTDPALNDLGCYSDNAPSGPQEVGTLDPNPVGLYDMHGNVKEWCLDYFVNDISSYILDPVGPSTSYSGFRVYRGGAYNSPASDCRAAKRIGTSPGNQLADTGFRPAIIIK